MKKVVLSLALVAMMFVSCKETAENTEATVEETVEAVEATTEEAPAPKVKKAPKAKKEDTKE